MDIKVIVAIIRRDRLEDVEKRLQDIGVERINVSKVKGYGEYHDFFARNWMVEEVRVEIFTRSHKVETITAAIMDAAHTGLPGDGIVAVMPVEKLFLVRTRSEATSEEFWPRPDS
ncbi:MAG: P-II family nitrogen regulator [Betaproteobacteria bacterium]|nr:P-II family nitrogen regulator [Betaproteobacteria bacterium]